MVETFKIANLVPYEESAVETRMVKIRKAVEDMRANGDNPVEQLDPIRVLIVDEHLMATNGANRCKVLKECGIAEIRGNLQSKSAHDMKPYRDALPKQLKYKGFPDTFPVDPTDEERAKRYRG